jgi:hypothetical protein
MKNFTMMLLTAAVAVPLTFAADAPKDTKTTTPATAAQPTTKVVKKHKKHTATAATKPATTTDTKPVK